MPKKTVVIAALLATLCMCARAALAAPRLYLTTEGSAPASMLDANGRVIGDATEKVREIMARAGIDHTIELMPWKRAYALALQRRDACVFSTSRTPERESLFKWIGPTAESTWILFARADRNIQLGSLEDARRYRIGAYGGDAREQFLRGRGFTVETVPDDVLNLRKLMVGRIDLWASAHIHAKTLIAQNGWQGQIVPVLGFNRIPVYLACNRAVPNALITRMNAALESMSRDGTMRRIERKYQNWTTR